MNALAVQMTSAVLQTEDRLIVHLRLVVPQRLDDRPLKAGCVDKGIGRIAWVNASTTLMVSCRRKTIASFEELSIGSARSILGASVLTRKQLVVETLVGLVASPLIRDSAAHVQIRDRLVSLRIFPRIRLECSGLHFYL